jgi:platelet-activating factor acetylhydrolase
VLYRCDPRRTACRYSILCSELAAQGYLVLAVEHADGSACAARLPGGEWRLYGGLGDEEAQVCC